MCNAGFLEKWPILGLGQEIYEMSLRHYIILESKKLHTKQTNQSHTYVIGTQEPNETASSGQS